MKNNYLTFISAFLITLFSLSFNQQLSAKAASATADCGCNVTLSKASDGGIYANGSNVKPGNKVCIPAGTYPYISLTNFKGTASAPIQIVNCGGQVIVNGSNYGFMISDCAFFKLSGAGAAGVQYGFKTTGGSVYSAIGMGINSTTDFTIDHVEIHKAGVGVICKKNPTCDASTWEAGFTMRNLDFHDMYLHDIEGEGFYVGHTSYTVDISCNGATKTVLPQKIRGLKIYNCLVDGTGWDGIQVASTPENAEIYNNTVKNFGTKNFSSQQAGILLGGLSNGKVYNNLVVNGTGNGIQVLGIGHIQINNNVVVNVGGNNVTSNSKDGIFIDDRPFSTYPGPYITACNNTVINARRTGIRMENTYKTIKNKSEFHNNLVVASGESTSDLTMTMLAVRNSAPNNSTGNLYLSTVAAAKFIGASDYHLNTASPAVDAGVAVSSYGVVTDMEGKNRSMGARPDAGAFESGGASAPGNQAPVVNAGTDKVITLPVNSVSLVGSGADADGSIAAYSWTKIAGPAQFTISNTGISNPSVSNLVVGSYTFRLTVTDNANATSYDDIIVRVDAAPTQAPPVSSKVIPGKFEAESFDAMYGIKTEATKDAGGGSNISWVHYKDYMDYNVSVASAGTYTVNLRVACYVNTGAIQIQKAGAVLATVTVPNTGGYQTWRTVSTSVSLQAGNQTLRIYSSNGGAWFLNWVEFVKTTTTNSIVEASSITPDETALSYKTQQGSSASVGVYPNPVVTNFTLHVNNGLSGMMKVQIIDLSGAVRREVRYNKASSLSQVTLTTTELPAGTYFVSVQIGSWKESRKFIKL